MTFTRQNLLTLRRQIEAALAPIAKEHKITIKLAGGRFSPTNFRCKLEADAGPDAGLSVEARRQKDFELHASLYCLRNTDFGKPFRTRGSVYTICGLSPGSRKYPILARSTNGTVYKFGPAEVLRGLGRTKDADKIERLTFFPGPELED